MAEALIGIIGVLFDARLLAKEDAGRAGDVDRSRPPPAAPPGLGIDTEMEIERRAALGDRPAEEAGDDVKTLAKAKGHVQMVKPARAESPLFP